MWGAGVQEERREVRADALAGQILRAVIEVNDKRRPSKKKKSTYSIAETRGKIFIEPPGLNQTFRETINSLRSLQFPTGGTRVF